MARIPAEGERPLDWVGNSKRNFLTFPEPVKDEMGNALGLAQFGGKHPSAKPWKGQDPGVSPRGIKTAQSDIALIERRLRTAQQDYEARHGTSKDRKKRTGG